MLVFLSKQVSANGLFKVKLFIQLWLILKNINLEYVKNILKLIMKDVVHH